MISPITNFQRRNITAFSQSQAKLARQFHQKIAGYHPTPLCALDDLANLFGVKKILVKDESKRFGLNAFKMLGGAYAIAQLLCEKYHLDIETLSFEHLKNAIGEKMTFATTTDGNHGRGVAWAAQQLGQNAVIYMPKGSAQERVDAILNLGAECIVTDMNYDDTVRLTMQHRAAARLGSGTRHGMGRLHQNPNLDHARLRNTGG